ncbi:MAG: hypothetical protein CM1200mP30_25580 [Pseudomonadota bacterium]|nr:MAG: hypothetical protein CM1200mP30_25580 [Pseudomonadota bacterium]
MLDRTDQLPEWYHKYLGRKGGLTSLLKKLKPSQQKRDLRR